MSSVAIGVKYSDDSEVKCIRRIMSKLWLSAPEGGDDILCLSKYRTIERAINANFIDLNKLHKLTEENKRLRKFLGSLQLDVSNEIKLEQLLSELGGE